MHGENFSCQATASEPRLFISPVWLLDEEMNELKEFLECPESIGGCLLTKMKNIHREKWAWRVQQELDARS